MTARELHEKFDPLDAGLIYAERETILRALSLLASVEESQDDIVSKLRHDAKVCVRINEPGLSESLLETAAALVALKAERDEIKRHAEAMVAHLNDGIQVDVDPEDGTQSPRSEWDFVANELVAAYRRDHKEEA